MSDALPTDPAAVSLPVLDEAFLRLMTGGDAEFERELLEPLRAQLLEHSEVSGGFGSGLDREGLRQQVHRLRGAAAQLGFKRLAAVASEIESELRQHGAPMPERARFALLTAVITETLSLVDERLATRG